MSNKQIIKTLNKAQGSVGHASNGKVTATGGYKKIGQLCLNGVVHTYLAFRDTGVGADTMIGDVNSVGQTLINHEQDKVDSIRKEKKKLSKRLGKAKGKKKNSLNIELKVLKAKLFYYEKQLGKAVSL